MLISKLFAFTTRPNNVVASQILIVLMLWPLCDGTALFGGFYETKIEISGDLGSPERLDILQACRGVHQKCVRPFLLSCHVVKHEKSNSIKTKGSSPALVTQPVGFPHVSPDPSFHALSSGHVLLYTNKTVHTTLRLFLSCPAGSSRKKTNAGFVKWLTVDRGFTQWNFSSVITREIVVVLSKQLGVTWLAAR